MVQQHSGKLWIKFVSHVYLFEYKYFYRRVLKNRPPPPEAPIDIYKLPLNRSAAVKRESVHSINGAIGKQMKEEYEQPTCMAYTDDNAKQIGCNTDVVCELCGSEQTT